MFQKELLIVARFQTVLCHNCNVDIKTHVFAPALNRISDTLIWLQMINWYDSEARLMAHGIAPILETPLKMRVFYNKIRECTATYMNLVPLLHCRKSHEFIIFAFYDEGAGLVAMLVYSFARKFEIPDSGADLEACSGPTNS